LFWTHPNSLPGASERRIARRPESAKELTRFLAGIWQVFNQYELAGYVASQKPAARKQLRRLLYMA